MIGRVVNYRYEVLEKCGDGNFFSVYKARDKVLNRLVALKVLVPLYAQNTEFAARLMDESQMVTELNHPNIAKVLEADSQDGTYFLAVEYVRGINLKDRIRRTAPLSVAYAVDIALAVAEALDHAHRRGVVHGDVRPHNILTSPEGQIRLTDFGSATVLAAFPTIREATMLRSVHYMAPEVIRGEPAQPASDVYSLGVVLYEMLTGSVPYDGDTSTAVVARQLQDPVPSPRVQNAGVPNQLNDIVMKAMQKDPAQRFASMAEFAAALARVRDWLRTGQNPAWPPHSAAVQPDRKDYYDAEPAPEGSLRSVLFVLLGILVVGVVTLMILMLATGGLPRKQIIVPDLIGKTWDQAKQIADRQGIDIKEERQEYNDSYAAGQVYFTSPPVGGNIPAEKPELRVWISKGPKLMTVPDVVGSTEAEARTKIADAGLVLGQMVPEASSTVPADKVIRQKPAAGEKQEKLKAVDIVVSSGPPEAPEGPPDGTPPRERQFTIDVTVPSTPRTPQDVTIEVDDVNGSTTAYEDTRQPGDRVIQSVTGFGENVDIKVYIAGKLRHDVVYGSSDQPIRDREY